jgi:hypothetical protein
MPHAPTGCLYLSLPNLLDFGHQPVDAPGERDV